MHTRKAISPDWILATRVGGGDTLWPAPYTFKGDLKIKRFAETLFDEIQGLLAQGKLRFHRPRMCEGGFEGILDGLSIIRRGEVSGEKLVYTIDEGWR